MLTAWASLMVNNKAAYDKLVSEIRGAFKSESEISWNSVKDLPYLGACIAETFRVCPPVPTNLCRTVPPEGGMIDGNFIPGGVSILTMFPDQMN
jgi:cytochrome P450